MATGSGDMHQELIDRVVFSEERIARRVRELGAEISADYGREGNAELAIVSVLKGGFVFLADLIRTIDIDLTVDFMSISSYGETGSASSGVRIIKDLSESIYRRNVLVVEDIIDTGLTLSYILRNLREREPRDLRVCTLLDRNEKRIAPIEIDYRGFEIGEEYVVGYGLDHLQRWRNLRFICTLGGVGPKEWHGGDVV
jgi:hypoxanthine phosphoribosyltransferase